VHEVKKQSAAHFAEERIPKKVHIYVRNNQTTLTGEWHWDLLSDAVFCSDVMLYPPSSFEGTRSIIHPDDVALISEALFSLDEKEQIALHFRIITSFGEIKNLSGTGLKKTSEDEGNLADPQKSLTEAIAEQKNLQKEHEQLLLRQLAQEESERANNCGTWYFNSQTNETYFSDQVYVIYGIPPQSLNAHLNTFLDFIHPEDKMIVTEAFDKAFQKELPLHIEFRILLNNGQLKIVRQQTRWTYNAQGHRLLIGVLQDRTLQHALEQRLETLESTQRYYKAQLLFAEQSTQTGYWTIDFLTRKTEFSDNFYRLFGLKPQAIPASFRTIINYVYPDDQEMLQAYYETLRIEHAAPDIIYRISRADGKLRYIRQRGKLIAKGAGEMTISGIIQDITHQKVLERKLQEFTKEVELRKFISTEGEAMTQTGTWWWDLSSDEMNWSNNIYHLLGYKPQTVEMTQKHLLKLIHADDRTAFNDAIATTAKEGKDVAFSFRILRMGMPRYLQANFKLFVFEDKKILIGIFRDITDERLLQQQLSEKVRLAELLTENILDRVMITDLDNNILLWNKVCEQVYKLKREQVLQRNFFEVFPQLNNHEKLTQFSQVLKGDAIHLAGIKSHLNDEVYELHMLPLHDEEKNVIGILHVVHDITHETELRENLKDRLAFIESLVDASMDRIVALDRNMNYTYWNRKAESYYHLRKEDVLGKNILEVFPGMIHDPSFSEFRRALRGETIHIPADIEKDDAGRAYETFLIPVLSETKHVNAVLWVTHDVSKEFELIRYQKNAAYILNAIDVALIELDFNGRYHFINDAAENFLGMRRDEVIGSDIWSIIPNESHTAAGEAIKIALLERQKASFEYFSEVAKKWLFISAVPSENGVIALFYDRHEIIAAQQRLQEEHQRLKEAQAIGHIGNFEWDPKSDHVEWSDELYNIYGIDPEKENVTLQTVFDLVYPDEREEVVQKIIEAKRTPGTYNISHRFIRRDGAVRYINRRIESYGDAEGIVLSIKGTVQDVTDLVEAQEKIRQHATLLRETEEIGQIGSYEIELYEMSFRFSDGLYRLLGEEPQSFIPSLELLDKISHPDDAAAVKQILDQAIATKQDYTYIRRIYRKDGEMRILEANGKVVCDVAGRAIKLLGLVQDITDRRKAEEEILQLKDAVAQRATDKYLLLFNSIDEGFYRCEVLFDEDENPTDIIYLEENPAAVRITGISVSGKTVKQINPDYDKYWFEICADISLNGGSKRMEQYAGSDGKWYDFYITKIGDISSRKIAVVFRDITERKSIEDAIQRSEERLKKALSIETVGVLFFSLNGGMTECNAAFEHMFGYHHEELQDLNWQVLTSTEPESVAATLKAATELSTYGETVPYEKKMVRKDGTTLWALCAPKRISGEGKEAQCVEFILDITEQKLAEQYLKEFNYKLEQEVTERTAELQKQYTLLQQAEDIAQAGSWDYDIHTGTFSWSAGMFILFETEPGTITHPDIYLKYAATKDDKTLAERIVRHLKNTHSPFEETLQVNINGHLKVLKVKGTVAYNNDGHPHKMLGVDMDITQLIQAEEEIRKSQHYLQQVTDTVPDAIIIFDLKERSTTYVNRSVVKSLLGYEIEELDAMGYQGRLNNIIHPEHREELVAFVNNTGSILEGKVQSLEYRIITKEGQVKWVVNRAKAFTIDGTMQPNKLLTILQDVTETKAAAEALRENSRFIQEVMDATPDFIMVFDFTLNKLVYVNKNAYGNDVERYEETLRLDYEGIIARAHADDQEKIRNYIESLRIQENDEIKRVEYRVVRDDQTIWYNAHAKIFKRDENGKPLQYISIIHNITDEVKLRKQLYERTLYAESLIDSSVDRMFVLDSDFNVLAWNKKCEEYYNKRKKDVIGSNYLQIFPKIAESAEIMEALQKAFKGEAGFVSARQEIYLNTITERFYIPLQSEDGHTYAVLCVLHDVTKAFQAREELKELNKALERKNAELESKHDEIATFAFVASHDLKEPLRKIHTFSDWLLQTESEHLSKTGKDYLRRINQSVKRVDALIEDILILTKVHADRKHNQNVDLNEVLYQVQTECRNLIKEKGAVIETDVLPVVTGSESQLIQLFRNLISNGIKFQKKDHRPQISITCQIVPGEEVKDKHPLLDQEKEYAKITFIDNGIGMEAKYAKKIFQVFQRLHSKDEYGGTGMGLAICRKVMENHEGMIELESSSPEGSSFACYFPL